MSETWLKTHISTNLVNLPGYRLIRHDREGRGGGGIGLYVRAGIGASILASSPEQYCAQPEYLLLSIIIPKCRPFLLALVYRPPKLGFLTHFQDDFERLHASFSFAVVIGDFNTDLNRSSHDAEALTDFCSSNHLFTVPFNATHHTSSSHTWIDHCFISDQTLLVSHHQQLLSFLSMHDLIEVTLNFLVHRLPPRAIRVRDYTQFDLEAFHRSLLSLDWTALNRTPSLDERIHIFNNYLINTRDLSAPIRTFKAKRPPAPWLNAPIRSLMRKRDAARRAYRSCPSSARLKNFQSLRKEVSAQIDSAKSEYLQNRLGSITNSARLWAELRSLGLAKSKTTDSHLEIPLSQLNTFFTTAHLTSPATSVSPPSPPLSPATPVSDPFYFSHITPETLRKALLKCSTNSTGPDDLSRRLIMDSLPVTFPVILDLFNISLNSSTFPLPWKLSYITPIPKIKQPQSPSDYRPISILPHLSKVLERIVHDQLSSYLYSSQFMDPLQAGFRRGNSTQTALVKVIDDVRLAIDKRMVTLLILFDFSKAFDCVRHDTLMKKLSGFTISAPVLSWLKSYLSDRSQCVRGPEGALSPWETVTAGVPQGSVLGPLLFAVYINDLKSSLKHCSRILYADDLQIYMHFSPRDLETAVSRVREDIAAIEHWASSNSLTINARKTKAMLLGTAKHLNAISTTYNIELTLNDLPIELTNHAVNLGVHLTSTLNWSEHVRATSNRINGVLWRLKYHKNCLSTSLRVQLVSSLIFPYFDYCTAVLTDLTGQQRLKLRRLMNACVRFIYNLRRDDHVSHYYETLGWLSTDDRRTYLTCCFLYPIIKSGSPSYLASNFRPHINLRGGTRAPPPDLAVPSCRTATYQRSFHHVGVTLWNSLPTGVKNAESLSEFKYALLRFLWRRTDE